MPIATARKPRPSRAKPAKPKPVLLPGQVVLAEIGLANTLTGLQPEFPTLAKSTVWRWGQVSERGVTSGLIPSQYHRPLLRLAQRLGRTLTADDLVNGRVI